MKFTKILSRMTALLLVLVITLQLLPAQALGAKYRQARTENEIQNLRTDVSALEDQVEDLLGCSVEDLLNANEQTSDTVTEVTEESAFTFDAQTGTVTGFTAPSGKYTVVIPSAIGGVTVSAIGARAFAGKSTMLSISIPATVTSIGTEVFSGCYYLEKVTMDCSVTEIPYRAFYQCYQLSEVNLPDSVTAIGDAAFYDCRVLNAMTLPQGLLTIGREAFYNTRSLAGVTELPASVTSVGYRAFYCGSYESGVKFTELDLTGVAVVGQQAFNNIPSLTKVTLPADLSQYGTSIFSGCSGLTTVLFTEGAALVPASTFYNCSALSEVSLPKTVTAIGNNAFNGCTSLADIDISGVSEIAYSAFKGCCALRTVTLNEEVQLETSVFSGTGLMEISIPDSITAVPDRTFENCTALRSVNANYLTKIGISAFQGCTVLTTLPDMTAVNQVGSSAFADCLGLTQLDLYALETDLIVGNTLVKGCTNLKTVIIHGDYKAKALSTGNVYDAPFSSASEDLTVVFDGNPTAIGSALFKDAPFVRDLSILPQSVTEYYEFAFSGTPLTEITIPEHITKVRAGCFSNCASLVKVTVMNPMSAWMTLYAYDDQTGYGNTSIDKMGFFAKTYLADHSVADDKTDITFCHESWTEIPHGFFAGSYIRDTEFLEAMPYLENLEPYSFYYCTKLENPVIPEGVTTINYRAFAESMGNVRVLTIPASVTELKARSSTSTGTQYTQHFYMEYSSALTDIYIYNPDLELYAEDFNYKYNYKYTRRVFGTYSYSTSHPLTIHGVVDAEGNSTAKTLCEASGGRYVFVPIGGVGNLSLKVLAGQTDVTDQVSIRWCNSEGMLQGTGAQFRPHAAGIEYTYTITLPGELLGAYYIPESGVLTSGESDVSATVTLEPIPDATFTIKAPENALVKLTQNFNGLSPEYEAVVPERGCVSFTAKQVYTHIAVSYDGCYTRYAVISRPETDNTVDLSDAWSKLPAVCVLISALSELDGDYTTISQLSDMTFTVKDSTGKVIPTTLQGNLLYPDLEKMESAEIPSATDTLTLEVAVDAASGLIAPAEPAVFTFADREVNVIFKKCGHIRMKVSNWSASDPEGFYLWIFDQESGNLIDAYDMYYGFCQTDPLAEGTYTVVAVDMSVGIQSVPDISALKLFGLSEIAHYYKKPVAVTNGKITDLGEVEVPDYATFGGALFVDMFDYAHFDVSVTEPTVGQNFYLWLDYKLADAYASTNSKQILIQLPLGTYINRCYTPEGKGSFTYDEDTGVLTIITTINEGQVYLSVKGRRAASCASVVASAKVGAYTAKPVSQDLPIRDIYIEAYDVNNGNLIDRTVSVYTVPYASVMLYVDGAPYQVSYSDGSLHDGAAVTANAEGKASFKVTLSGPATASTRWELTATAVMLTGTDDDYGLIYETESPKTIGYYVDPFNVHIFTQSPWCANSSTHNGSCINYNDVDNRIKTYWMKYCNQYIWSASVAPGMGKYIKDGVIYVKLSLSKNGAGTIYLGLTAITPGGDNFFFKADEILMHNYIDYYFDVTDEYYTEFLGQPVPLDMDYAEAAAQRDESLNAMTSELTEFEEAYGDTSFADLQAVAQTDQDTAAMLELKAILTQASIEASNTMGFDVRDYSEDEIIEAMGITTRALAEGELQKYADDSTFMKIETAGVVTQYVYSDAEKSIVADVEKNTVTEYDYLKMASAGQRMLHLRDGENEEDSDSLLSQLQEVYKEVSNTVQTVQFSIENIGDAIDKYSNDMNLSAALKSALKSKGAEFAKLANKALGQAMNVYNFFEMCSMIAECESLNDRKDAILAEMKSIVENGGDGLADPQACLAALSALMGAYSDLVKAICHKGLSLCAQLMFSLVCLMTSIGSFGFTLVLNLIALLAGYCVDATLDENIERARQFVKMREKEKSWACRPDEDEGEDDPSCRPYMDPSGYVYEGVFSNRVEGLEVTTYTKDDNGEAWDAQEFGQENPLVTDDSGFYRWDVPVGLWKVVVSENEDYYGADTTEIYSQDHMREGRTDITEDGWHTVLPIQTEVHIPVVSRHAPTVKEEDSIAWSDSIFIQFSQYMKEETLAENITVTMGDEIFTGEHLVISWPDQELSDHYYNRTFASQLRISRADGKTWVDRVTVHISGGENYAGTTLDSWSETMEVIPVIDEILTEEAVALECEKTKNVTLTLLDAADVPIGGIRVEVQTEGFAVLSNEDSRSETIFCGISDANGQLTLSLTGRYPGQDTMVISIPGREEKKYVSVFVGSETLPTVEEPVVTINGKAYSGQGNEVEVETGTVITVTGHDGHKLYYSIGETSCPCREQQIFIGTGSGSIVVTESGYYKFAAYAEGVYSSRVHISVTVRKTNPFVDVPADAYYYDAVIWAVEAAITNGVSPTEFSPETACTRAQMVTFLWRAAGSPETTDSARIFDDVPADAYYAKAVQWAYETGITKGTGDNEFSPDDPCTRAQMATFLWRAANSPDPTDSDRIFDDVPADAYYAKAVQWAYETGITKGTGDNEFSPGDPCTRAQMVTFLWRCAGSP